MKIKQTSSQNDNYIYRYISMIHIKYFISCTPTTKFKMNGPALNQPTEQTFGICLQLLLDDGNQDLKFLLWSKLETICQKYLKENLLKIPGIDISWCSGITNWLIILHSLLCNLYCLFFPKLRKVKLYTKLTLCGRVQLENMSIVIFLFQS